MDVPHSSNSPDRLWLDQLPLPAVIIRQRLFVYANRAFLELMQLTAEQVMGMPFDERVAPEDLVRVRERHARRMRGERVNDSYELTVVRADGEKLRVEIFVTQLEDATVFQLHDVTDRVKRLESLGALARLGASVQGMLDERGIFETLDRGLSGIHAAAVRLRPDEGAVRVFEGSNEVAVKPGPFGGWSPALMRAWETGFAFVDDLRPSSTELSGAQLGPNLALFVEGTPFTGAALMRLETPGRPNELLMLAAPWIRPEDEVTLRLFGAEVAAAVSASKVVSDLGRRNAELAALNRVATAAGGTGSLKELFSRAAFETAEVLGCSAVAIYLLDRDNTEAELVHVLGGSDEASKAYGKLPLKGSQLEVVVNEKAPRVWLPTDYNPEREAMIRRMGQTAVASVPMLARSRVIGVVNAAWTTPRPVDHDQLSLLMGLGVHLAAAVESGRLIDDLRRSYEDLTRTQHQLVQRERLAALGEMAAAVAHEVRNPLAVVFNSVGALRRHPSDLELLGIIQEEAERIDHLVGDLLEFARPMTPQMSAEVQLKTLLEDAVKAVLSTSARPVKLQLKHDDTLGPVHFDSRLMRQVFVNLATNALQALPVQGGTLTVTVAKAEGLPARAKVSFEDSGHGIPPDVLPRIFEPFFTTRARGTGLGLALVKRIIEGHRGTVTASSRPGVSVLTVEWPVT